MKPAEEDRKRAYLYVADLIEKATADGGLTGTQQSYVREISRRMREASGIPIAVTTDTEDAP